MAGGETAEGGACGSGGGEEGGKVKEWQAEARLRSLRGGLWRRALHLRRSSEQGPYIGQRLLRHFEGHEDIGAVVQCYLPPGEAEDEPALWWIEHDDGEISRD